ncbi:MAG: DUF6607 family protein [Pseudomonadota bacterium]
MNHTSSCMTNPHGRHPVAFKPAAIAVVTILFAGCAATPGAESAPVESAGAAESEPAAKPMPEYREVPNPGFAAIREGDTAEQRDRLAILAMRGEHRVDFHFMETVRLGAGYRRRDDKTTGAFELVQVVTDTPDHIVLQHLLVMESGYVIKHWRQDWTYEASTRFEFVEDQTWDVRDLAPEHTAGAWTQCVFEVSDAPRYCGTGKWQHDDAASTWTSDRTWRPLPRREYTTRDDYNAIDALNRHTVTPHGWTHEQDNTKTARDGRKATQTLVREFGFNDYRAIEGYNFGPGVDYWDKTAAYWADVRAAWTRRLAPGNTVVIDTAVDGMQIITATFKHAESADSMSAEERRAAIETLLETYVQYTSTTDTDNATASTR